jgi:hypothetical protein
MRFVVGGSEAKHARAPWPRRGAKRPHSRRAWLQIVEPKLAMRSTLVREPMSACSFGNIFVANAGRRGQGSKGYKRGHAIKGPSNVFVG